MRERSREPRPVAEVATAAKNLYATFMDFQKVRSDPARYTSLGRCYAILGIEDEGIEALDLSRHDDTLSFYKLGPTAREMAREAAKVGDPY